MTLINDEEFSDVYITPQKEAFIWSRKTPYGLRPVVSDDYEEFLAEVEKGYEGEPSYLIIYKKLQLPGGEDQFPLRRTVLRTQNAAGGA